MSTNYYGESSNFSRIPTSGVQLPVSTLPQDLPRDINGRPLQERIRNQDTTVRWINDSITGQEKFQVTVNIDGFHQNEIQTRVDGRKLIVYGEHIESKNQSTAKKIIEKTYELPQDVNPTNPRVTFSGLNSMQIEFLSRHSNVIYDNDRSTTSSIATNYDLPLRPTHKTGFQQERSSSEFTSTRKIGGTNQFVDRTTDSSILSQPDHYLPYEELINVRPTNRRVHFNNNDDSYATTQFGLRNAPYETINDSFRSGSSTDVLPPWRGENANRTFEKSYSESHREFEQRRSSPVGGVQTTREVEHHQSGSPSTGRFLSGSPLLTKRNTEVQEFSRRIGTGLDGIGTTRGSILPSLPSGFNSDAFYRSAFQPQFFTNERGEKSIEMKLNVSNYQPSEVKISVTEHDLIVRAEHKDDRTPKASSRSYFYKQVTLPPNTDLNSLTSDYLPDGTLSIKAKLFPEQTAIRHNY